MDFIKRISLAFMFVGTSMAGMAQTPQQADNSFSHTVMRGQTLYSIASMYGVSVDDIVGMNPGSDKQLRAGETLRIPQQTTSADGSVQHRLHFHTIQAGETLYRITQKYRVSADVICKANPGLSTQNFRTGQVIVIPITADTVQKQEQQTTPAPQKETLQTPPCRATHKVKRKETIFSITRQYGISEQELMDANPELKKGKLKKGTLLCIPHKRKLEVKKQPEQTPSNEELISKSREEKKQVGSIDAALILPFNLEGGGGQQASMVEFYEGFLLAVDSLKQQKVNINLHVFDSGEPTASISHLLDKPEMKKMDIIFGPRHTEHIKPLSDFAKAHDIRLVIPFTPKDSEVFNNPGIYQINTPQSYLYAQVHKLFAEHFKGYNVIFVETPDEKRKDDYIQGLKQELDTRGITHHTIPVPEVAESNTQETTVPGLTAVMDSAKHNIIIPTSSSDLALIKLIPLLQLVVRAEENPYKIHLFGYPEWQTYYEDYLQAFYELDTYFYSSFYTNNLLQAPKDFQRKFRHWYDKEMRPTYPKYGMLGFDTGYYFLQGLHRYGAKLEENLHKFNFIPVQTGFHFERVNNWGGFINKKVFFVHMTRNHELIKLDFEQ